MLEAMQKKFIELAKKLNISSEIISEIEEDFKKNSTKDEEKKESETTDLSVGVTVDTKTSGEEDVDKMTVDELKAYAKKMAGQGKPTSDGKKLQDKLMGMGGY